MGKNVIHHHVGNNGCSVVLGGNGYEESGTSVDEGDKVSVAIVEG